MAGRRRLRRADGRIAAVAPVVALAGRSGSAGHPTPVEPIDRLKARLMQHVETIADRDIQTSAINLSPRYSDPERDAQAQA